MSVVSSQPSTQPAVVVDGVSKSFRLPQEQVHTLKERALHPLRRTSYDTLSALRDVSFGVREGEFFGIVGRNGSGKSTLLKCLAGIYGTDKGQIYVNGRLSTFIELGVGFNPDLGAYDNVRLNATMLGLSPKEARNRFDRIIDFAELHDFVDLKLKNYSSGMLVRLAFSVMIQVDAEVLLIDEVLAVGDVAFQQKCFDEFGRIRASGTTVLFVTHDMSAVQRFCDRAMLLEKGRVVELGDTELVAERYVELNFSEEARQRERLAAGDEVDAALRVNRGSADGEEASPRAESAREIRLGDGTAEILEAWFETDEGRRTEILPARRHCTFKARVRFHARRENPLFGAEFQNTQGLVVWGANNIQEPPSGVFEPGDEVVFSISFQNVFAPDRYYATVGLLPSTGGVAWLDRRNRLTSAVVTSTRDPAGVLELDREFEIDRSPAPTTTEVLR